MSEKYFAASNSGGGFCSYYDETFNRALFDKIYVIKGGSGTGKAFFMKRIAAEAEKRGMSVRYIYCSSDADSLDGIIVKEMKLAVLDGTSPHVFEPQAVGAIETIVDLGTFLNEKMLRSSRRVIEESLERKSRGFKNAYAYLSAYREVCYAIERIVKPYVRFDKIEKFTQRFVESIEKGKNIREHLLTRSIGMRGLRDFDTYREGATVYYRVNDYFDTAHFFMKAMLTSLEKAGADVRISPNPIIPERTDVLCATSSGLTFEISNEADGEARNVNMKRFTDAAMITEIRGEYRAAVRVRDDTLSLALSEFEKIKKYHFILEEIYGSAMDFKAKEQFTDDFCKKIFQNN